MKAPFQNYRFFVPQLDVLQDPRFLKRIFHAEIVSGVVMVTYW